MLALCPAVRLTVSASNAHTHTHSTDHNFRQFREAICLLPWKFTQTFYQRQSIAVPGLKYNHATKTWWGRCKSSTHSAAVRMLTVTMFPRCWSKDSRECKPGLLVRRQLHPVRCLGKRFAHDIYHFDNVQCLRYA